MAAMIIDRNNAAAVGEAAGLAGVAHGLTLILADPARRGPFLPDGLNVPAAIAHARKRLSEARALLPAIPKAVLPAFLPVSLTEAYLKRIEKAPDAPLAVSPIRRQFSMWWHARRENF